MKNQICAIIISFVLMGCSSTKVLDKDSEVVPPLLPLSEKPEVVSQVLPDYPEAMRTQGIQGTVVIKILVDEYGDVKEAEIVKSLNSVFDQAAIKAAKQWKFKPGKRGDKPVKVWMTNIPIDFKIKK